MKNRQKSFTIIELLLVIAIIGVLASLVFVSIKGVMEIAGIAGGIQFGSSVYHGLGAYAVGIWDFDEEAFPVKDRSGNGNDGNCTSCPDFTTETPNKKGYALEFNGSDDCIEIPDSDTLDGMDVITIELWIKPYEKETKQKYVFKEHCYEFFYEASKNHLEFKVHHDNKSSMARADVSINIEEWHHLVAIYNGSEIKIFLDAKQLSLDKHDIKGGAVKDSDKTLYLGCKKKKEYYKGIMDNVKIYEKTFKLSPD